MNSAVLGSVRRDFLTSQNQYSSAMQRVVDKANSLGYTKPSNSLLSAEDLILKWILQNYTQALSFHIQGMGSIEFGTLNLINPDVRQHILSSPFPTYSSINGVKSDGSSSYIRSRVFTDEIEESSFTIAVYITESSTAFSTVHRAFGARILAASNVNIALNPLNTANTGSRDGFAAADTFVNTDVKGLYLLTGNGSNVTIYKDYDGVNGVKDIQVVSPTLSNIINELAWLARNGNAAGGLTISGFFTFYQNMLLISNESTDDTKAISFKTMWDVFRAGVGLLITMGSTSVLWGDPSVTFNMV